MPRRRPVALALSMVGAAALTAMAAVAQQSSDPRVRAGFAPETTIAQVQNPLGVPTSAGVRLMAQGAVFSAPSGVVARPGRPGELWVSNMGNDSLAVVTVAADQVQVATLRDAYAEHFVARPAGIAFTPDGDRLTTANDSSNEVRGMRFRLNPERNVYFTNNNFMGPALFAADSYARAGQSKRYLQDWPQPGYGHDPFDGVARNQCPPKLWSVESRSCQWPREGSHTDMLHGNPRAMGVASDGANSFYLLDGCGRRTARNRCTFRDGHVARVDFNRDHQEGNGFHGDGIQERFIDAPFRRVEGVPSGMTVTARGVLYADTGAGVVRLLDPRSGTRTVMVRAWHGGTPTRRAVGAGTPSWEWVVKTPGDGDTPPVYRKWVAGKGNRAAIARLGRRWIAPQETLGEYAYITRSRVRTIVPAGVVQRPSGVAADARYFWVADHATGRVLRFRWSDGALDHTTQTGLVGVGGLGLSADGTTLYLTVPSSNALYQLPA